MGHMDVVPFISKGLNVYYPMTVLLICFCTYFNIGSRILHCFGVQQFLVDEDLSVEYVNEGKDIVRKGTFFTITPFLLEILFIDLSWQRLKSLSSRVH